MRPPPSPPPLDLTTDAITALRAAFTALVPPPDTTLPAAALVALLTAAGEPPPSTPALAAALARAVADGPLLPSPSAPLVPPAVQRIKVKKTAKIKGKILYKCSTTVTSSAPYATPPLIESCTDPDA